MDRTGFEYHEDEAIYDEWGFHETADVEIDFLLPTGIYIQLNVPRTSTIEQVKQILWVEAVHQPLFNQLVQPSSYIFNYISMTGTIEMIVDESKHLSEYDLFESSPLMTLVKSKVDIGTQKVVAEIQKLSCLKNEEDFNFDLEYETFRRDLKVDAENYSKLRDELHWKQYLEEQYPPSLMTFFNDQLFVLKHYGCIYIHHKNISSDILMEVSPTWSTIDFTREVVELLYRKIKLPSTNPDDYVLRSRDKEYIVGDHMLHHFKTIRNTFIRKRDNGMGSDPKIQLPSLTLLHIGDIRSLLPQNSHSFFTTKENQPPPLPEKSGRNTRNIWQVDTMFNIQVLRASNVQTFDKDLKQDKKELFVHVGVVHGSELLCRHSYTKEPKYKDAGNEYVWDETLSFDLRMLDLPRSAKLCVTLYSIAKSTMKKINKENLTRSRTGSGNAIGWVNTSLFDFRGVLKTGELRLRCWDAEDKVMDKTGLNLVGPIFQNPNEETAPVVILRLMEFPAIITYPSEAQVMEEAASQALTEQTMFATSSKTHLLQLKQIIEKDSFTELTPDETSLLWKLRFDCRDNHPEALAKVLSAVKWNSYRHVAMAQALLSSWPLIKPNRAIGLLNIHFADIKVRQFAVRCLMESSDTDLQQYLLQLVQALKFEMYIDNSLARFILHRAWRNRKIGHYFFWNLKSELTNKSSAVMSVYFSVLIEGYLYGNIPHLHQLFRQSEAFVKMRLMNERVKADNIGIRDIRTKGRKILQDTALQPSFSDALSNVECPLDPNINLNELDILSCKVMNSKMRPLWLVFKKNEDGVLSIIYKNGDDLRQDMLMLQIISIMDTLWKSEGLDLKMMPYGCLATSSNSGLIEVVSPANTIANIQKTRKGKMAAFRHQTLFEWIEQKANDQQIPLDEAIENFTCSCAGYCVATYVLGVGDRHSDNIMVTEKGQLFHIDFGHILGNFKSKLGIKRERVPFVLAHDFVHVINKGKTNEKKEFEMFRKLCDRAFLILRKRGHFIITLFALMLHSGLPELTSRADLHYLRDSLALHLTDEKATQQFRSKFNKALADAWSTSLNWFFHNVACDNK